MRGEGGFHKLCFVLLFAKFVCPIGRYYRLNGLSFSPMRHHIFFIFYFTSWSASAQLSKSQVTDHITAWYASHPDTYELRISGNEAEARVTRYHPERLEESDDLIEINYQGMRIQLKFDKPLAEITLSADSLQLYFSYVSIDGICHDIPSSGWDIHPHTPASSLRKQGVTFSDTDGGLDITIRWSIYTVMGYRDSQKCRDELSPADGSVSEDCYVSVDAVLPLLIAFSRLRLIGY